MTAPDSGAVFEIRERNYYALGYWDKNRYWEPKLPQGLDLYPLGEGKKDHRPRFRVREYYHTTPTEWPADMDEFEDLVNQPSLVAYRLAGFDAGKDGE